MRARRTAGRQIAAALAVTAAAAVLAGGCDTVDLGTPPAGVNACRPGQQFFIDEIWPNVLAKDYGGKHCADSGCHSAASPRLLVLRQPAEAAAIPLPADWSANYISAANQMQCADVASSDLVRKPTGQRSHAGGKLFEPGSPEATLLEMWVAQP